MTPEEILALDDLTKEPITIPEWGNEMFLVRTMTAGERDAFEQREQERREKTRGLSGLRARLVVETLERADGTRVFNPTQADALSRKSGRILGRIFDVAVKLNGMNKADIEELAKNSETAPDGAG